MRSVITPRAQHARLVVPFSSNPLLGIVTGWTFTTAVLSRRLIFHTSLSGNKRGSGINKILSRWEGLICENDKLGVADIRFLDVFIRACANSLDAIWRWQSWASWHPPGRTLDSNDRTWCTRISSCVWLSKIDLHTVGAVLLLFIMVSSEKSHGFFLLWKVARVCRTEWEFVSW